MNLNLYNYQLLYRTTERANLLSIFHKVKLFDSLLSVLDQSLRTLFIQRRIFLLSKLTKPKLILIR